MAYRCPVCNKSLSPKDKLVDHIIRYHRSSIPEGMTAAQYLYSSRTGSTKGPCMVCNKLICDWNSKTDKPFKICDNPECTDTQRKLADKNHRKVHGKSRGDILADPMYQMNVMHANQDRARTYRFADGGENSVLSSLEYAGDEFLEKEMGFTSKEVIDCPHIFYYMDNGKRRAYIPDRYLPDYNLIIEYKEGGDMANTNPHYIRETKYKQKLKAEAVRKDGRFNYIIVEGTNYDPLVELLVKIKEEMENADDIVKEKHFIINESVGTRLIQIGEEEDMAVMQLAVFTIQTGDIVDLAVIDDPRSHRMLPFTKPRLEFVDMSNDNMPDYDNVVVYNIVKQPDMDINGFWKTINGITSGKTEEEIDHPWGFLMDLLAFHGINVYLTPFIKNNVDMNMDFGKVFECEDINAYIQYVNQIDMFASAGRLSEIVGL